jgi:hypothetical protein
VQRTVYRHHHLEHFGKSFNKGIMTAVDPGMDHFTKITYTREHELIYGILRFKLSIRLTMGRRRDILEVSSLLLKHAV